MRRYDYESMSVKEFSEALDRHNLTMREFCYLTGYAISTVERWLQGSQPIAHNARMIITYWDLYPSLVLLAGQMADEFSIDRREVEHAPGR